MEPFLRRFFPRVLERMASARGNEYCLYDSQTLTAFTSSLYVAGLLASLVASRVTRAMGRQAVMLMGGALFFAGGAVTGAAVNIAMLIVGRMLLGFGVGFTNQVSLSPLSRSRTIRSSAHGMCQRPTSGPAHTRQLRTFMRSWAGLAKRAHHSHPKSQADGRRRTLPFKLPTAPLASRCGTKPGH
jgi:hypothetical protein